MESQVDLAWMSELTGESLVLSGSDVPDGPSWEPIETHICAPAARRLRCHEP